MQAVPVIGQVVGAVVIGAAIGVAIYQGAKWLTSSHAPELTPISEGDPTPDDKRRVNEIGGRTGCMTCGASTPGTKTGNWPVNHVPPRALRIPGEPSQGGPHCLNCQSNQGGKINGIKNHGKPVPDPEITVRKP